MYDYFSCYPIIPYSQSNKQTIKQTHINCCKEPSMLNALHVYYEFSYNEELESDLMMIKLWQESTHITERTVTAL